MSTIHSLFLIIRWLCSFETSRTETKWNKTTLHSARGVWLVWPLTRLHRIVLQNKVELEEKRINVRPFLRASYTAREMLQNLAPCSKSTADPRSVLLGSALFGWNCISRTHAWGSWMCIWNVVPGYVSDCSHVYKAGIKETCLCSKCENRVSTKWHRANKRNVIET